MGGDAQKGTGAEQDQAVKAADKVLETAAASGGNVDRIDLFKSALPDTVPKVRTASDELLASISGTKAKPVTIADTGADKAEQKAEQVEKPPKLAPGTAVEEFVKTEPVRAVMFREPTPWVNKVGVDPVRYPNGKEEIAQPGDFKVYEKNGVDFYVVPKDQFLKSYTPNPGFHRSEARPGVEAKPADSAGEYIKLGIVKAQRLPAGEWPAGGYMGGQGDYLLEDWQGKQYIVPKKEFEELYSPTNKGATEAETLRLPKGNGVLVERPELGKGVTSEAWENGHIIRDPERNTVTVTNTAEKSMSVYDVDPAKPEHLRNRLIVRHQQVGDRLVTNTISYEHSEKLATTAEANQILAEKYAKGSKYLLLEEVAMSLPDTSTEEYAKKYNETPAGQLESREQLQARLEKEAIAKALELGATKVAPDNPHKRPRLDLVIGLPAAGKSTFIRELKERFGSAEIESDLIKERMPEFNLKPGTPEYERLKAAGIELQANNGLGATSLMQESNLINDRVLAHMMSERYNIVLPGVGLNKEWTEKFIKEAQKAGYDVHLTIIDTAPADAINGAISRFENPKEGRYVNPRFIGTHGERPSQNFAYLSQKGIREGWLEGFKRIWNQGYVNKPVESSARIGAVETVAYAQRLNLKPVETGADAIVREQTLAQTVAARELELLKNTDLDTASKSAAREIVGGTDGFTNKQLRDLLKEQVLVSGKLLPRSEFIKGNTPPEVLDVLYRASIGDTKYGGAQAAEEIMLALHATKDSIKDEATRKLTESILAENDRLQREAQHARRMEVKADMKASSMSLIALAAVASGVLAYANPEASKALVEKLRKVRQGSLP